MSKRTRICHVSTVHPALDGRIFYREALTLRELGYDVTVYAVHPRDECIEGVEIRASAPIPSRLRRMAGSWLRGLRIIRRCPADIYHFHDPELLPAALLAKLIMRKKVVFDAHEDVSLILLKDWMPRWLRLPVAAVVNLVDRITGSCVDAVIVPTRRLKERYARFARRCECYHNFPAPEFLARRDQVWMPTAQRAKQVVHVGTLSQHRLDFLVDLARKFLDGNRQWTWAFIGLRPEQLDWFERNVSGAAGERIEPVGMIPHLEVARRCCQALIGVNFHMLASRQIQVAIPLKVFEYLACGLSVVSTRVPLLVELVEDCPAVAFADESADDFLDKLNALAAREDLDRLGSAGREFVDERFNCRAEARKLSGVYQDILGSK